MAKNIVLKISEKGAKTTTKALKNVGGAVTSIGKASAIATAGIGALSVKLAGDFQKSLLEVGTLIKGFNENQLADMSKELRSVAISSGVALDSLAKAKYDIVSAGFSNAADSAKILDISSRLAVGGVTSAAEAADILTTALNAMGKTADEVEEVSDSLFTTVRLGKTTMSELSASMGQVLPFARSAKLSLDGVNAAMATITASGISTAQATTSLRAALVSLQSPAESSKKAMEEAGVEVKRFEDGSLDLVSTIQQFRGLDPDTLKKMIPRVEAILGIEIMAGNIDKLRKNVNLFANESAGATEKAFDKMSSGFNTQMAMMKNGFQAIMIEIGNVLIEKIQPSIESVNKEFSELGKIGLDNFGRAVGNDLPLILNSMKQAFLIVIEFIEDRVGLMGLTIKEHIKDAIPGISGEFEQIEAIQKALAEKSRIDADFIAMQFSNAFNIIKFKAEQLAADDFNLDDIVEIDMSTLLKLEDVNSELEAMMKNYQGVATEIKKVAIPDFDAGSAEDYKTFPIDFLTGMATAFDQVGQADQEFFQNLSDGMVEGLDGFTQFTQATTQVFEAQYKHRKTLLDNQENAEIKQAQRLFQMRKAKIIEENTVNGQLTKAGQEELRKLEQAHQAETQNIKENFQQKDLELRKKMKPAKIAEAISNTALGVSKALGSTVPPFNFALAALVAAAGALEVKTIQAQEFATGGIVPGKGNKDTVPAMLTPGELILNKSQQENLAGGMGGITLNVSAPLVDETILDTIIPAIEKAQKMNLA